MIDNPQKGMTGIVSRIQNKAMDCRFSPPPWQSWREKQTDIECWHGCAQTDVVGFNW